MTRKFAKTARLSHYGWAAVICLALLVVGGCEHKPATVVILHTNDIHGHFLPAPGYRDRAPLGGFLSLQYHVAKQRERAPNSLLLDAGDLMTGNLICNISYRGADGGALIEMMNAVGYDGMVFGNHDFDKHANNLRRLIELARFPIFCANFRDSLGHSFVPDKYHIYQVGRLRVGVIGITYHPMAGMAKPENLDGFNSIDPVDAVTEAVATIDDKTDLIVILSHLGLEADRELAKKVSGVDVIVGGHSHSKLDQPEKVNGVLIVQAGSHARYLGCLELAVAGDSIQSFTDTLLPLVVNDSVMGSSLRPLVDSMAALIEARYGEVICTLRSDWRTGYQTESNVGNWLADALRQRMGTDVAIINSGGIRRDIPAGPVTLRDIEEMLPFENYVSVFECSGTDLKKIFVTNADSEAGRKAHGTVQLSGVTYSFRMQDRQPVIVKATVGGRPLDAKKVYRVATVDYVLANADKYLGFEPTAVTNTPLLFTDLVIEAARQSGVIDSKVEGRIRRLD